MPAYKRILPWVLFMSVFLLLYYTSYPSIGWWDSGGLVSNAYNLSIPDPGGSILFVILGRVFTVLFFFLPAVKAVTLVTIISACLTAVFTYRILLTIFDVLPLQVSPGLKMILSFTTALSVPFLYSIWSEANVSREYVLGLFLTSVLVYCSVKIWLSENTAEKRRLFFLTAFIMGIDFASHRLNTPFIPVLFILLIFPMRKELKHLGFWIIPIVLYVLGLSLNLFILIRSPQHPPVSMDDVRNFSQLFDWINMSRYGQSNFSNIFNRMAPFWSYQVNFMYLRYFWWNFIGSNGSGSIFNSTYLSYMPLLLGLAGFIYSLIKRFKIWIFIFSAFFFFSFGLIVYSNIREGFDNIREIDRLFIPSFYIFMLWTGIGIYFITGSLYNLFRKLDFKENTAVVVLAAAGLIFLPLNIISTNWRKCDKSSYYFPYDFAYNLLTGCGKDAVLFTNGDNDTFPLWELQSVENIRPDIAVVNLSLLNTDYYVEQLQRQYKLFPPASDILNPGKFGPSVIKSPVKIKIFGNDPLAEKTGPDTLTVEYAGRNFGKEDMLLAQDKALITLLEFNGWARPVYFSNTVDKGSTVGLSDYIAETGITGRLLPVKGDSILPGQTEYNLLHNYKFGNFNNPDVYADGSTASLFNNYRYIFADLAKYYLMKGNRKRALMLLDTMKSVLPAWRFTGQQNQYIDNFIKNMLNREKFNEK